THRLPFSSAPVSPRQTTLSRLNSREQRETSSTECRTLRPSGTISGTGGTPRRAETAVADVADQARPHGAAALRAGSEDGPLGRPGGQLRCLSALARRNSSRGSPGWRARGVPAGEVVGSPRT